MDQTILTFLICVAWTIPPIFLWWLNHGDNVKASFLIKNHVIPLYDELESADDVMYPVVMEDPYSDVFPEFSFNKKKDLTFYFFVRNNSFVIIRETDLDFYIEIPFSDVLCQECSEDSYKLNYYIVLRFVHSSKIATLAFHTLTYDHKLDEKYGNRLTGDELCLFIRNTFIPEREYEDEHDMRF